MNFPAPQSFPLTDALHWSNSPDWVFEAKKDGVRALLVNGELQGRARSYALPGALPSALAGCTFDGELVGHVFWVFDVIEADGQDLRRLPLRERKRHLLALQPHFPDWLKPIPSTRGNGGEFLEFILASGGEGVVAKRLGAKYGRDWFKAKRRETFDVIVASKATDKLSVSIGQLQNGALVGVGRVAVLSEKTFAEINPGDVLEIATQGRTVNGKFREPRLVRIRTDKPAAECVLA